MTASRGTRKWRGVRKSIGLTQTEAGKLVGVHAITYSAWERGKTEPQGLPHEILSAAATKARSAREEEMLALGIQLKALLVANDSPLFALRELLNWLKPEEEDEDE